MADPNMSFEEGDNGTMVVKMKMVFNDITKYGSISLVEEKMTKKDKNTYLRTNNKTLKKALTSNKLEIMILKRKLNDLGCGPYELE